MKQKHDSLRQHSMLNLDISSRDKDSVVATDLQKFTTQLKRIAKKKDLVVMVFEK